MKLSLFTLLLLLASASAARAQDAQTVLLVASPVVSDAEQWPEAATVLHLDPEARQRLLGRDRFAMIATGTGFTLGVAAAAAVVDSPWPLAIAPLISGFAVAAIGDGRGYDGSGLAAVGGALIGGVAGGAMLYITLDSINVVSGDGYGAAALGSIVYLTLPSILGTVGYSASLGSHSAPDGERVPSLGVRIGL